jgi:hypothetical protein
MISSCCRYFDDSHPREIRSGGYAEVGNLGLKLSDPFPEKNFGSDRRYGKL